MTALLRIVRLLALSAWVGSLFFFGVVAYVAFSALPDPHQAGLVVRGSLIMLHRVGFVAGTIYLLDTLGLLATGRDTHSIRAAELALVIAMLGLTAYSQFSVIPRMESDRIAAGGDIDKAPLTDPHREHFERLHQLSVKLEGAILVEGACLLAMSVLHGRDDFDRFA